MTVQGIWVSRGNSQSSDIEAQNVTKKVLSVRPSRQERVLRYVLLPCPVHAKIRVNTSDLVRNLFFETFPTTKFQSPAHFGLV